MKYIKLIVLGILLFSSSSKVTAQETIQPQASITIKTQGTSSPVLQYLLGKYSIEDSERILLNIKDYEVTNNVFVLSDNQYKYRIQSINNKINLANNIQEKAILERRKNSIVNLLSIEALVTK